MGVESSLLYTFPFSFSFFWVLCGAWIAWLQIMGYFMRESIRGICYLQTYEVNFSTSYFFKDLLLGSAFMVVVLCYFVDSAFSKTFSF